MSKTTTNAGHDSGEALTEPAATTTGAPPPLTGFAAGITGAVLLIASVWGLHAISSAGGFTVAAGSVILLLAAFTALGKGITLLQRALGPILEAATMAVAGVPALVRAFTAIVVGAIGVWWVLRGHAAAWWTHTTGTSAGWTLASALVQVALIAVAGALLFGGAKTLAAAMGLHIQRGDRWTAWWSSRPGLGLMLLAGAAAIVALSGYIVPRVSGWLASGDPQVALTAIAVILIAGLLANTWWWGALSGWWTWAHRPHAPGGGATPMGQIYAGAGVVALLWFSATAFGLAVPDSYTGPGAMPRARADCPPDCGGSSGGSNSFGPNGSQFQPPQMPDPPGQYQSGANSYPGLDQNNGISLYNPGAGQGSEPAQGGYASQGQPGPPANGVQPPNYDAPPSAQASAPQQGSAGPQQPSPGAQQGPGQDTVQQAPAQQGLQQQPAQQPQGRPQPGQPNQPPQQGQLGQQRPQSSTNQPSSQPTQQQPQDQKPTTPKKQPNNPVDPTDLAAAATRRGSQRAGQQAAQTTGQQATQQATRQTTHAGQQVTQQATQTAKQPTQATQHRTGFDDWANGEQGANESRRKTADQLGNLLGSSGDGLSDAAKEAEAGSDLNRLAKGAKILKGIGPVGDIAGGVMDAVSGAKTPIDALGNTVSGMVGGAIGGVLGSALGPVGTAVGSYLGNKIGQGLWDHKQGIIDAVKDPADAASKIGGQISSAASALADNTASALGNGLKAVGNFLW